jgi:hypothetical protein
MMRVDAMDPDGTSDKSLLADMAHDIKVLKDRRQDSMLELASKKAIILKQAIEIELQAKTIAQQAEEIAKL